MPYSHIIQWLISKFLFQSLEFLSYDSTTYDVVSNQDVIQSVFEIVNQFGVYEYWRPNFDKLLKNKILNKHRLC